VGSRLVRPNNEWRTAVAITASLASNTVWASGSPPYGKGVYVKVTTAGAIGVMQFAWGIAADDIGATTGVAQSQPIVSAAAVLLSCGVTVNFGAATYALGDEWWLTPYAAP
jgi:hypothetical protein